MTAMLDLALHHEQGPIALADIAARQGISLSYLEQLFSQLRRRGLVDSTRGPGGGYRLVLEPGAIVVSDVIGAVDENMDSTRCHGKENCQDDKRCLTHDLWTDLTHQIQEFLSGIDLAQLVERQRVREVARRQRQVALQVERARGAQRLHRARHDGSNETHRGLRTPGARPH